MEDKVNDIEKSLIQIQVSQKNQEENANKQHDIMVKILDKLGATELIAKDVAYLKSQFDESTKRVHKRVDKTEQEIDSLQRQQTINVGDILQLKKDIETNNKHKWFLIASIIGLFVTAIGKTVFK